LRVLGGSDVALGIAGHVGDTDHQSDVVALALDVFGRIDLLVNNTEINPVYGPLVSGLMNFGYDARTLELRTNLQEFMEGRVHPAELLRQSRTEAPIRIED
jgi:NAD(P)-dependent dehydrogenase (short-subunit alcohol dehydrogenase family)